MKLHIRDAACGYGARTILEHIDLQVTDREILCILGPNGVGKTTLFKTILGLLPPLKGEFLLNGYDMLSMSRRELARRVSFVPQSHTPPFSFQVRDVIVMGRTAHLGLLCAPSAEDYRRADRILAQLGIEYLAEKHYTQISGGERQMVLIARSLIQEPELLIMDEPTSNLDFGNQVKILRQVKALARQGIGVIMTSHVPDHGFMCATKVLLIEHGQYRYGSADEIITEENLRSAYGVEVFISRTVAGSIEIKSCVANMD